MRLELTTAAVYDGNVSSCWSRIQNLRRCIQSLRFPHQRIGHVYRIYDSKAKYAPVARLDILD